MDKGSPGIHQNREGTGSQSPSHCSSQGLRQPGTSGAAAALGIAHLHGGELRPGWSVSPAHRWGSGSGPVRVWPGRATGMGMSQGYAGKAVCRSNITLISLRLSPSWTVPVLSGFLNPIILFLQSLLPLHAGNMHNQSR